MESIKEEFIIGDLDVQEGIMYCGGKDRYINILQVCCDAVEENKKQIEDLFEKENWKDYIIAAHGIKSSMRSIGAKELSERAKNLEMAGREGDIKYIQENHRNMMQEYERVIKMIQESSFVEKTDAVSGVEEEKDMPVLDAAVFEKEIQDFEDAVYSLDESQMFVLLEKLQGYQYGGVQLEKPLSVVVRKVKQQDYMSALDCMKKLKTELDRRKNE